MDKSDSAAPPGAATAQWADQLAAVNQAVDPFGIGASFADVTQAWLAHPIQLASSLADLARNVQAMQLSAWQAAAGLTPTSVVKTAPDDVRFADAAWTELPAFALLKNYYLLYTHWLQDALSESPGVPSIASARAYHICGRSPERVIARRKCSRATAIRGFVELSS